MRLGYAWLLGLACASGLSAADNQYDVVIYGGTASGVAAAVQAKRMGKSVVVIEPTRRLGGLTSGGLGQTDIGNKAAIGGLASSTRRSASTTTIRPLGNGRLRRNTQTAVRPARRPAKTRCGHSNRVRP